MDSRRVLVSLMADTLQTNSEGRGDLSHVKKGGQSRPPLPAALDRRGSATRIKNAASVLSFSDSVRGDCVCSFAFLSVIDQLLRKIGRSSFDRLTGMKCSPTDMET
jgi:hypothetical protein